jgi:hypothetical protein
MFCGEYGRIMTEAASLGTTIALVADEDFMKAVLFAWRVIVTALLVCTFVVAAGQAGSARGAADKDGKLSGCLIRGEGDGAGYLLANPPTEPWLNSPDKQVAPSALGTSGDYATMFYSTSNACA